MNPTLKGKVSITRWHGNKEPYTGITITLIDELSGCQCVEIEISPEQLGLAVTGSQQDCEFQWRPQNVGMKSEHKTETVPFDGTREDRKAQEKAVAPFEVDGWKCSDFSSLYNHHRNVGGKNYRVGFTRYVQP